MGVIGSRLWQTADAVITVSEQLDAETGVISSEFVKPCEQLVQHVDKFLSGAL